MYKYVITIDTDSALADFLAFISALPAALRLHGSAWIVRFHGTAKDLRDSAKILLGESARIWVGEIGGQCAWVAGDYASSQQLMALAS